MSRSESANVVSADKPLADPKDDRLGYAPFARHLAESICKMSTTEGLVVALYGPWGSGKTTLLNFVVHYLKQKPQNEQPIIVHFNPWWFSGREDLTMRFFDQLKAVLSKRYSMAKDLSKRIGDFAEIVSETPIPYATTARAVAKLIRAKHKDVVGLKESIEDDLRKQERRILVVIDDIDRLTTEEIRQLFRVVKAVADFPNIIYLMAFDRGVAIIALEEVQRAPGEAYLEKIVQVPFVLPLPDKTSLRRLLFEKLDAILANTPEGLFDQTHWGNVYLEGIDHFIATPRDIIRLTNTLNITYPAVRGEVNPVDFIAIETLRVFSPFVYDIIRKNPEAFAGYIPSFSGANGDKLRHFHDSWVDNVKENDREPIKRLLLRTFPKLQAVWSNTYYSEDSASRWRRQLCVCSSDIFPIYFRLAIPEGSISTAEMGSILALAGDSEAFGSRLTDLANQKRPDGTTRVRAFLEHLEDYTEEAIPLESIPSILRALFDVGDELLRPEDDRPGMFEFGNDTRIGRVIFQLLPRLDQAQRFEALQQAMSQGRAVTTIAAEVVTLGQFHGKYGAKEARPEEERPISSENVEALEKIAVEKMRAAAQSDSLLRAPKLSFILYNWRDWTSREEVRSWVEKAIGTDEGLVTLLEGFLQKTFSQSLADAVGKTDYRLDPQWIESFLEPSKIINRVRALAEKNGLTDNQRTALRQFIREYEIREQGKDPNAPFALEAE